MLQNEALLAFGGSVLKFLSIFGQNGPILGHFGQKVHTFLPNSESASEKLYFEALSPFGGNVCTFGHFMAKGPHFGAFEKNAYM